MSSIAPASMDAGDTIGVTVSGSGFVDGGVLTFENGPGSKPGASSVVVAANGESLTATINVGTNGPPKNRVFDVVWTNSDGAFDALVDGFTVAAQGMGRGRKRPQKTRQNKGGQGQKGMRCLFIGLVPFVSLRPAEHRHTDAPPAPRW